MSDLFIEVDEALKQERLEKLWKEYGGLLLSFLAMIILGTAANAGYHSWVKHRNYKQTNLYLDVVTKEDVTADSLLALLPDMTDGMKAVVSMRAAGIALENGNTDKALGIYKNIEADPAQLKQNPLLHALAKYMVTNLDTELDTQDKIKRLKATAAEKDNPWTYNALLDAALLEASQNKNYAGARSYLAKIIADNSKAPQGIKQKAVSLDILYQAQQNEKP